MKVILLTQYYPPETGAPQNRLSALATSLNARGHKVTVLTAMPNYPEMQIHPSYKGRLHVSESIDGVEVKRVWLLVSKRRGIFWRLCNYFSFVLSSLIVGIFGLPKSDVLFVESPPLFLGITAIILSRLKGAKLVFNVSDLWPESAVQLGLVTNKTLIRISTWLELKCYRSAALISGQTKGIVADIKARCPEREVVWLPNGADLKAVIQQKSTGEADLPSGSMIITYAGIIGHAQGLEVIVKAAELLRSEKVCFLLIGEGPVKKDLQNMVKDLQLEQHVRFIGRIDRDRVFGILRHSDAVVVPLRRNELFKGAIPSKIFEALALEKPLLLGVEGEAKELFIHEGNAGLAFIPEDPVSLAAVVRTYLRDRDLMLEHGRNGGTYVRENFDRSRINDRFIDRLEQIAGQ